MKNTQSKKNLQPAVYDQVRRGGRWLWQRPNREGGAEMREDVVSWGQRLHGDQAWRRS